MRELLVADGRAEVGEEAQVLAQAQDGLLGAQRALELVVFPVAYGTEEDGVSGLGQVECGLGQGVTCGLVGGATHGRSLHLELEVENLEDLDGLGDDFGADAITGQDCDFHERELRRLRGCAVRVSR